MKRRMKKSRGLTSNSGAATEIRINNALKQETCVILTAGRQKSVPGGLEPSAQSGRYALSVARSDAGGSSGLSPNCSRP